MCMYYPAMVNVVQLYRINLLLHAFPCNTAYCTLAGSIFTRPSDNVHAIKLQVKKLRKYHCNRSHSMYTISLTYKSTIIVTPTGDKAIASAVLYYKPHAFGLNSGFMTKHLVATADGPPIQTDVLWLQWPAYSATYD